MNNHYYHNNYKKYHHHHHYHRGGKCCPVCGSRNLRTTYTGAYSYYVTCKKCGCDFQIRHS